jgi:hypothetical protein
MGNVQTFRALYTWQITKTAIVVSIFEVISKNVTYKEYYYLFSLALQPSAGYGLLVSRDFLITHNDAPQSVELFWTSDQLVAETST